MKAELILFFISMLVSGVMVFLLAKIRDSEIRDRRMKSFYPLGITALGWIVINAVTVVINPQYFAFVYSAKMVLVIIVPYMSTWFFLNFTESKLVNSRIIRFVLITIPALDILAMASNPLHWLYFFSFDYPYVHKAPIFNIHIALLTVAVLFSYVIIFRYIVRNFRQYPILFLTGAGVIMPFLLNLLYAFNLIKFVHDVSSLSYFFTIIVFIYFANISRLDTSKRFYQALVEITKSSAFSSGILEESARIIVQEGSHALSANSIRLGIWSIPEDKTVIKNITCYDISTGKHFKKDDLDLLSCPEYFELIKSERVILISDTRIPNPLSPIIDSYRDNICSMLDAPIRVAGKLAGLVCIEQKRCREYPEKREWTMEEQNFVSSLADFMTIAISRAAELNNLQKQKEAEANTREADERAKLMLEQAPLVVMLWDENLQIIDCNQEPIRVFGVSNKREYIERFFELTPECQPNGITTLDMAQSAFTRAIETGYSRIEWWMNHAISGENIPFEVTSSRVKYKDKYVVITYALDLRERNAAIAKMREADERAQIIFYTAPFASIMFDKNIKMIDCNQEVMKLFGIPDREFFLKSHSELIPEYQPSGELSAGFLDKNIRMAFEEGYHHFECMHRKLNGEPLPVEVYLVCVKYRGDDVIAGYFRDLTEQKAMEQLTKIVTEKTSILTAILDATPDLIFCKDLNLRYIEINKAMETLFNTKRSLIVGKTDVEAGWDPPDLMEKYNALDRKIIFEQQTVVVEEYIEGFDGRRLLYETIKTPLVQDSKVTGLVGMSRDITQRKEMARLARQQAEAEAANHAKSSFLASMSHEIRTPMNAILGITEVQLQNGKLPLETKNALNIVYNSGYTLLGIINDLLDLSKIEAGKLELTNNRYEIASLINDTINLNMAHIGSKPIEFKLQVDENLPYELIGDELHIKQILNNLLSNAFKYTDSGEVRLSFTAEAFDDKAGGDSAAVGKINDENNLFVTLTITVCDTGQGMTEDQVKSMFDAYSRFNMKMNRYVEGTGLGMNIVQQLVEKMDGDITVNSAPGKGTEVTVHLVQGYFAPAKLGSKLAKNLSEFRLPGISKMEKAQIVREHMPYGKVLVVDDMETNLFVAKGFLLPYGLSIDTALSGREVIEKIENGNIYDIVFMDHMMPVMDGVEAVKIIREKGYTLPIVALTANALVGQAEMFMVNGFDGFISKPIDIRELNASLNKFVRDRQPPEMVKAVRAAYGVGTATVGDAPQAGPELLKIFIKEAEKEIATIESYEARNSYGDDDLQAYTLTVHSLKSALANIGETTLSIFARDLEQAGREKDIAFITEKNPEFLAELRAVVDRLKSGTEEPDMIDISNEDLEYLRKMLLVIKEACMEYEKKDAKSALAELKQKQWPGEYGKLLDTIGEHLLHSDFDEAVTVCSTYLSDRMDVGEGKIKL
jgi:PAS domain S-box-containing protein